MVVDEEMFNFQNMNGTFIARGCCYLPVCRFVYTYQSLYLLWVAAVELLTIVFILSFCSMTPSSILWRLCSKFTLRVAVNNNITTLDHLNFPPLLSHSYTCLSWKTCMPVSCPHHSHVNLHGSYSKEVSRATE